MVSSGSLWPTGGHISSETRYALMMYLFGHGLSLLINHEASTWLRNLPGFFWFPMANRWFHFIGNSVCPYIKIALALGKKSIAAFLSLGTRSPFGVFSTAKYMVSCGFLLLLLSPPLPLSSPSSSSASSFSAFLHLLSLICSLLSN